MALLTFLSDFGEKDHYTAAVKAAILKINPTQHVLDITHQINRHDIGHAAYVLRQIFREFPDGTVHLIAVDPLLSGSNRLVAIGMDSHYFVGHDSGIYHLISARGPKEIVELAQVGSTFPAKDVLATASVALASGRKLNEVGTPSQELAVRIDRQLKATKREIVGQVIHIDHFGNLITNINRPDFDAICKLLGGNPAFTVRFAREAFNRLHRSYTDVEGGECFVLFNAYGLLEIGINKGRASDLLGLKMDTQVIIEFNS